LGCGDSGQNALRNEIYDRARFGTDYSILIHDICRGTSGFRGLSMLKRMPGYNMFRIKVNGPKNRKVTLAGIIFFSTWN
jgi:hypothetical protein